MIISETIAEFDEKTLAEFRNVETISDDRAEQWCKIVSGFAAISTKKRFVWGSERLHSLFA